MRSVASILILKSFLNIFDCLYLKFNQNFDFRILRETQHGMLFIFGIIFQCSFSDESQAQYHTSH